MKLIKKLDLIMLAIEDTINSNKKWFPYNKGGNLESGMVILEYVVNWENDGTEIKENAKWKPQEGRIINPEYYFRESITWSRG